MENLKFEEKAIFNHLAQLGMKFDSGDTESLKKMPYDQDTDQEKKMMKIQDVPGRKNYIVLY